MAYLRPISATAMRVTRCISVLTFLAAILLGGTAMTSHAASESLRASEYQIKAVYLYNFLLFTRWPEQIDTGDSDEIIIGIVGMDPFGKLFEEVEGKQVEAGGKKRTLAIKRFGSFGKSADLSRCRLLFVSASEKQHFKEILAEVKAAPILTVADSENFLEAGGMINLVKVKDKIRWEVNRSAAEAASLRLNSMLLKSAVRVVQNGS